MNIQEMWLQAQLQKQGGMPGPGDNPAILAAMQHQPVPKSHEDPLHSGSVAAIHSIRQALSERPKRHESMMGNVLDSIGTTLQNVGIAKLRGSHMAPTAMLGNMMQTPHEIEQESMKQNMGVLDFLSSQAAAQQKAEHAKAELAEQRRYHDILAGQAAAKAAAAAAKNSLGISIPGIDLSQYAPMKTSKERNMHATSLKGATEAKELILRSLKNLSDLEISSKGSIIDPTGSVIPGADSVLNNLSRVTKKGMKKYELMNQLNSDFSNLEILLERTLKGGVPDAQTIERFHREKVYPGLGQPIDLNKKKLNELLKTIDKKITTDKLSLATGRHIDIIPGDEEMEIPPETAAASPDPLAASVSKVQAVNPNIRQQAILEAQRRLGGR